MPGGLDLIAEEAARLARSLPLTVVEAVASRLETGDGQNTETLVRQIAQSLPSPYNRASVLTFLDKWRSDAGEISPQSIAAALVTAARIEKNNREQQSVELVWTGPDAGLLPLRRTEQAVLQVLDSASKRITLVSYAVYNVPRIAEALVRAAGRGVRITIIVESPDRLEGQNTYSTLKALGEEVAACSTVYQWPKEQRKHADDGRVGILHVKCVVADGRMLFLSSANLTEYAFTLNMELGALITGGRAPCQIEALFEHLIQECLLVKC
jgi:phosphatidylserine/phosphatidylglycerophosphate/cardiolipin synthase-like enzyme